MAESDMPEIARENREAWAGKMLWAVTLEEGWFTVHQHHPDGGTAPQSTYATPQEAAARMLQMMGLKEPVEPQAWPENVCIGEIWTDDGENKA